MVVGNIIGDHNKMKDKKTKIDNNHGVLSQKRKNRSKERIHKRWNKEKTHKKWSQEKSQKMMSQEKIKKRKKRNKLNQKNKNNFSQKTNKVKYGYSKTNPKLDQEDILESDLIIEEREVEKVNMLIIDIIRATPKLVKIENLTIRDMVEVVNQRKSF